MPDLDALARADEKIRNAELEKDSELEEKDVVNPLQTFSMPSMGNQSHKSLHLPMFFTMT